MNLLLCGCFLLLTLGQCVFGQPPDDLCRIDFRYVDDHNYPDDWHLIVDSYDYETLFGANGVWERNDVDGDRKQWTTGFGGSCQAEIGACTFRNPNQNNWFFTDYNSYDNAIEVIFTATFRWSRCTVNSECTDDFVTVYKYDTNGPVSVSMQKDIEKYSNLTEDEISSRLQQDKQHTGDTTVELCFQRPETESGLYIGFQDTGTCGQIVRFQVYYRIAPPVEVGLLSCPEVPLVKGEITSAECKCADNSSHIGDLERSCSDDGVCSDLAVCSCDCGYHISHDEKNCTACKPGRYRSLANPMSRCIKCPPNTREDQPHACQCDCIPGYFRAKDEGPDHGCTSVPGPCTELEAISVGSECVTLRWKKPNITGSDDFWYTILRSDQTNIGEFNTMVDQLKDSGEIVEQEFCDLTPFTSYVFRVVVHNKVTDQDPDNEHLRRCDIKLTTLEGVPGPPRFVRAFCSEVVWGSPSQPNGEIVGYELEFYDENGLKNHTVQKKADEHFYKMEDDETPSLPFTHVRIRAKTATQNGEWSNETQLGCDKFSDIPPSCVCPEPPSCPEPQPCPTVGVTILSNPSRCPVLKSPVHGRVRHNGRKFGSFSTYSCKFGYKLVGSSNRMCQLNGTWSGIMPVCQSNCGRLVDPSNGRVSQIGDSYGSLATYNCNAGYTMDDGDASRMCNADGTWTGKAPKCYERDRLNNTP